MSSYTIDSTIIGSSTTVDTNVSVSLAGLSPGVYTVKVASVDYANRTGSYSNVLSFELKGLNITIKFIKFTVTVIAYQFLFNSTSSTRYCSTD